MTHTFLDRLEAGSWIDLATAERVGLRHVSSPEGAELVGRDNREDYSGIVIPVYWPGDTHPREYYLRRDRPPIENGKPKGKYLAPPGRGNLLLLGPEESVKDLTDTSRPIFLVEGLKKLLAAYRLARFGCNAPRWMVCAISGVWNWKGRIGKTVDADGATVDEKGVIADFDRIAWTGRVVIVVFDSDCRTNSGVAAARRGLAAELKRRGAIVHLIDLPALDTVPTTGLDDLLAAQGPEVVLDLIQHAQNAMTPEGDSLPARELDEQRDYGHASVLAPVFLGKFRWAAHRGSWMRYRSGLWSPVGESVIAKQASDVLRRHYADQLAKATDRTMMDNLHRKIVEASTYAKITGALNFLRGWPGVLTELEEWDADPWRMNCRNGMLDLRTGELQPHIPDDLCTRQTLADYEPTAANAKWLAHLEKFLPNPNIRRQVQRDLGRALVATTLEESLPIWYGVGANGKSTTTRALLQTLGGYADQAAPDLLTQSRGERHPTEVADLCGRRLAFSVEVDDGKRLAEALVKSLTGGDKLKARYMRQDFFSFEQTCSLILVVNHKPIISGTDLGIWRRIRVIPWEVVVAEDDRRPQDDVLAELRQEAAGILGWLVAGLHDWQQDRRWIAEEVRVVSDQYRKEQDRLGIFIAECCEVGPHHEIPMGDLYARYVKFCADNHEKEASHNAFGRKLRERGIGARKVKNVKHYIGICLGDHAPGTDWYRSASYPLREDAFIETNEMNGTYRYQPTSPTADKPSQEPERVVDL